MKSVAVLTSGGDAPGMNAAIRAVVRTGAALGLEVFGVRHGYTGLIAGDYSRLQPRDVGGIIGRGGTVLGTTRCEQLRTLQGQKSAIERLRSSGIDALIVIGGNGSQAGAYDLSQRGLRVIGIASTIDNDLVGSETSLGATTALDVALEAIDRLRVTAASHKRVFLVEVMGRNSGHLALLVGIAGGAEAIVVPEIEVHPESVADEIRAAYERGKSHAIVVVAEGAKYNGESLMRYFREHSARLGFELRLSTLGHIQRGGTPGVGDRMLGTRLGAAAVEHLRRDRHGILLGIIDGKVASTAYSAVVGATRPLDAPLLDLASVLTK
jgi:6-phosphofructokinase 1